GGAWGRVARAGKLGDWSGGRCVEQPVPWGWRRSTGPGDAHLFTHGESSPGGNFSWAGGESGHHGLRRYGRHGRAGRRGDIHRLRIPEEAVVAGASIDTSGPAVAATRRRARRRGPCPIHRGDARGRTFSVNLPEDVFRCFEAWCGKEGDVIDLWAALHQT